MKYFAWIAIGFVAIVVVAALFFVGSPAHQRQVRFDEERLRDLQSLQHQLAIYYGAKGNLPATLADMKGFEGFSVPLDPETRASYEYTVKNEMQFQLCAIFALASSEGGQDDLTRPLYPKAAYYGAPTSDSWKHSAGRACFDITLEKSLPSTNQTYPAVIVKPAA
ncbi:MAG: hypothetical protein A2855_02095 [Candidatus Liptonbacteria bacterium RIFCSPHIGHO2_01_FULL_57_28]|uniref:Type II secretion system protein GspG C-terminal domain-containing protein n=1 Tax=Candidatus Liptonbacteria bacterium RIFCSPHIGHO2_01_FULL_57_28 TaxID=1798647 RepID=A0A1G2CCX1_9BACT|nr:MAG: hypothetical protein A2855_02095 [Candidatus Liptonbacteria bacterium RIFCSPHIGHO2_01_FULL_57_28]